MSFKTTFKNLLKVIFLLAILLFYWNLFFHNVYDTIDDNSVKEGLTMDLGDFFVKRIKDMILKVLVIN